MAEIVDENTRAGLEIVVMDSVGELFDELLDRRETATKDVGSNVREVSVSFLELPGAQGNEIDVSEWRSDVGYEECGLSDIEG